MKAVLRSCACALLVLLTARAGRAQESEPDYEAEDGLRLSLGAGFNLVGGADTEIDGDEIDDPPQAPGDWPLPVGVLRADLPLHMHWLVGLQASAFTWDTKLEEQLDYGDHFTVDLSAVARLRVSFDKHRRSEVVGSLAIGPSFDSVELSRRNSGEDIDGEVGFHVGGFLSYQLKPRSFPMGVFVDLGFMHHWLSQTSTFSNGGRDEVSYQPLNTFLRVGAMFIIR